MRREMTFKEVLDKVDTALKLLGWKGGNDFNCWKYGEEYFIAFEPRVKKQPSVAVQKKLMKMFNGVEVNWIEDGRFAYIKIKLR